MEALLLGVSVGLVAGFIPGAYSTVVAATALERGLRPGIKVAVVPLFTEMPALLASTLVLTRLPTGALRWIGIAGGILLLGFAVSIYRKASTPPDLEEEGTRKGTVTRAAIFGVLSPGSWAFWFFLGSPLFLSQWRNRWIDGFLFLGAFFLCFIGAMVALAWAVGEGREHLSDRWYRWTAKGASGLLVVAGAILIWQSWVGNFEEMVQSPPVAQEEVEEGSGESGAP